jgi:CheY-like chemotaxis protein
MAQILRDEGFVVDSAADGAEALAYLHAHPEPSLILLDLTLSGMDGAEFRRRQLADARLSGIPVVVVSGSSEGRAKAKALRADEFLAKPINVDELLHVVQNRAKTVPRGEHFLRGVLRDRPS